MPKRKRPQASKLRNPELARSSLKLPPPWHSFVRLFHPFPSLVVTAVTVAMTFFADSTPALSIVVPLGVGMLCYQFAIGVANDLVDATDDAAAKPWKAIPRGLVSRRTALILVAALSGGGLLATSALPLPAWLIGMAGLACGLAYDVQLKRTPLSWLPFAVAFPLIPTWVFVAFDSWDSLLWFAFPLGAILGLALHLANQAPDIPRESHVRGLAHALGTERAANLALGLVGLAGIIAFVVLLFAKAGTQAILVAGAVMLAGVMARRAVRIFGPDGLFGLLASTSAVLAILFVSAIG
ncbi:MAG: UbiA family prenyltransferase [Dehalococcoidia bacterium]